MCTGETAPKGASGMTWICLQVTFRREPEYESREKAELNWSDTVLRMKVLRPLKCIWGFSTLGESPEIQFAG